jgi:hypothetical protein
VRDFTFAGAAGIFAPTYRFESSSYRCNYQHTGILCPLNYAQDSANQSKSLVVGSPREILLGPSGKWTDLLALTIDADGSIWQLVSDYHGKIALEVYRQGTFESFGTELSWASAGDAVICPHQAGSEWSCSVVCRDGLLRLSSLNTFHRKDRTMTAQASAVAKALTPRTERRLTRVCRSNLVELYASGLRGVTDGEDFRAYLFYDGQWIADLQGMVVEGSVLDAVVYRNRLFCLVTRSGSFFAVGYKLNPVDGQLSAAFGSKRLPKSEKGWSFAGVDAGSIFLVEELQDGTTRGLPPFVPCKPSRSRILVMKYQD